MGSSSKDRTLDSRSGNRSLTLRDPAKVFDQGELGSSTANSLANHIGLARENETKYSRLYTYYVEK